MPHWQKKTKNETEAILQKFSKAFKMVYIKIYGTDTHIISNNYVNKELL